MKIGTFRSRRRIFFQTALVFLFLLCTVVGNAWSDDIMLTAKTRQVSNVTSFSATLKGTVYSNDPSGDVIYSFQWGTTTSYENQTRNQSPSTSRDRTEVEVSEELTNLSPNTTYHYRLVVSNNQGQVYGEEKTFTTYAPPTVTTDAVINVTFSSATLIGTVNPNGMKTSVCFYYGPGLGEVNTKKQDVGNGTSPLSVSTSISTLQPGTTYFYRIEAYSLGGTVSGGQMSFTTPSLSPIVSTDGATNVTNRTATLHGTINPNETNVSYYFQWGPSENPSVYKTYSKSAGSGNRPVKVSATVSGLKPGTTYYYTILADYNYRISNVESKGQVNGEHIPFTTLTSPGAVTTQATNVTSNSAALNATITPNGLPTIWYFEYKKSFFPWKRIGTGKAPVTQNLNASVNISRLDPNSIYRFRIVAKNIGGTVYGPEMSFKTLPFALPSIATGQAYNITKNSATLEGIINPRGSPVSYWFQYGPTTSYGKASAGQAGIADTSNVKVSVTIIGLIPNTKYHYRLITSSVKGPVYGQDKMFTTLFEKPIVTTATAAKLASVSKLTVTTATATKLAHVSKPTMTTVTAAKLASVSKLTVTTATAAKLASVSKPTVTTATAPKLTPVSKLTVTTATAAKLSSASKPTVTTGTATKVTSTQATIHGTINPNGLETMYYFEYGPTLSYGSIIPTPPKSAGNGTSTVNVSADVTGKFIPANTYHYRIVATNKSGTTRGVDKVFFIPSAILPVMKKISPVPVSKSVQGVRP